MTKIEEKKLAFVKAMHDEIINPETHSIDNPKWNAVTIAARIRELKTAIRSSKWADACENYAAFIEEHANHYAWAYLQGSVYFASATI